MARSYEARMLRVQAYIHDNPAGDLSLDTLAEVAAMSRFHWHRVFRAMTGETCAQAVRRIRLHRAAVSLLHSADPVADIAASVGYPDAAAFSRAFSDAYGKSPTAFRKAGRSHLPLNPSNTGEFPMHDVTIRTDDARRMVAIAHKGPYPEISRAFEQFAALCGARDLWPQLGPVAAIYFDNPDVVPAADLRSLAGAFFHGETAPEGMELFELPAGRTAVLTFKGPYAGLHAAYEDLYGRWLPQSGEEPADTPCCEIYLNDPRDTAPDDLVTEICMPLKG